MIVKMTIIRPNIHYGMELYNCKHWSDNRKETAVGNILTYAKAWRSVSTKCPFVP